jgi:molecular chaperone GrpE (heat shock protein)
MMWSAAQNAAESAGLEIIDAEREPLDFRRHSAESTAEDNGTPNGYVIKTLRCGYVYRNEIMRRAAVVVNKVSVEQTVVRDEAQGAQSLGIESYTKIY